VAILIGIVSVTPVGFVGFLAVFIWVAVTGVILYLRGGEAPTPQTATG
jgi:hypothetical protein